MTPEIALRNRVLDLLRASEALAELVDDKVYDDVPSDELTPDLPWICLGPLALRRIEMGDCAPMWDATLRVFAESNEFNRDQAWAIARAGIRAIDRDVPPDETGIVDRLTVHGSADVIDPGKIKTVSFDVSTRLQDVD